MSASTSPADLDLALAQPCEIPMGEDACRFGAAHLVSVACTGCGAQASHFTCRTDMCHAAAGHIRCRECGGRLELTQIL